VKVVSFRGAEASCTLPLLHLLTYSLTDKQNDNGDCLTSGHAVFSGQVSSLLLRCRRRYVWEDLHTVATTHIHI